MVMDFLSHGADPLQTGIVKGFGNAQPQLLLFYIQIIIILLRCISLLIYKLLAYEQKFTAPLNGLHGQRWILNRKRTQEIPRDVWKNKDASYGILVCQQGSSG